MTISTSVSWTEKEKRAWRWPESIDPSGWAERYRELSRRQTARPGPWRNSTATYLVGIMDLAIDPTIEEITVMKAAQVGASEAIRNVIGYYADQEPDPVLLVLPDEQVGRKIMRRRIMPLFRDTPRLSMLLTERSHDVALHAINLTNGFTLSLGWSGSPSTLSSDPIRIVINDELDKFVEWSGREADPVSLSRVRTATYQHRRKVINISTPTTRVGIVAKLHDQSTIKLWYYVPCPRCGAYQRLTFDHLHWDKGEEIQSQADKAAWIQERRAAWYVCVGCGAQLRERDKPSMVRNGCWAVNGVEHRLAELAPKLRPGGIVREGWPIGNRIAMHISSLYCPWIKWAEVAAEFVRSQHDQAALQNFRNSWMGEVWEQQVSRAPESIFAQKCKTGAPPLLIPQWAIVLLATADVQLNCLYYVVRAWGAGMRSQRVAHGICTTFEELRTACLDTAYPGDGVPGQVPRYLAVDSGYRSADVYAFALSNPGRIKACKGTSKPTEKPIRISRVSYKPPHSPHSPSRDVWLHLIDTNYYKDLLITRINMRQPKVNADTGEVLEDNENWLLNSDDDEDYNRQMSAEHKILIRVGRSTPTERWVPVTAGSANHYWDCEVTQMALAYIARVDLIREAQQAPSSARQDYSASSSPGYEAYVGDAAWRIGR